jgi:hypothetical protein
MIAIGIEQVHRTSAVSSRCGTHGLDTGRPFFGAVFLVVIYPLTKKGGLEFSVQAESELCNQPELTFLTDAKSLIFNSDTNRW